MEEIKKISDLEKAITNPFLKDNNIQMNLKRKGVLVGMGDKALVDNGTGEVTPLKIVGSYREVDQEEFVKVFRSKVSAIFSLSKTGNKTLGFVMSKIEKNTDEIYIYLPELMEFAEWAEKRQAYRGLAELAGAGIVYPSTRTGIWFINPNILFNGDRVAFIEQLKVTSGLPVEKPPVIPANVEFEQQGDYVKARKEGQKKADKQLPAGESVIEKDENW
jgi:hypothetical protein